MFEYLCIFLNFCIYSYFFFFVEFKFLFVLNIMWNLLYNELFCVGEYEKSCFEYFENWLFYLYNIIYIEDEGCRKDRFSKFN